jgi:hypothetical protein
VSRVCNEESGLYRHPTHVSWRQDGAALHRDRLVGRHISLLDDDQRFSTGHVVEWDAKQVW